MPILLWVIYPYVLWSACVDLAGEHARMSDADPGRTEP
jgi:hypothetical protein